MKRSIYLGTSIFIVGSITFAIVFFYRSTDEEKKIKIRKSADFSIFDSGSDKNWEKTNWINIPLRTPSGKNYSTKAKLLYSETGMYFLFHCQDEKITATMNADFMDLWNEDVVEIFLWPDEKYPAYFEYELSPLNFELPIIVYNDDSGKLSRWLPFYYEPDRKTRHAVSVQNAVKKNSHTVDSWIAEFYIPYKLLKPLTNTPPKSGTVWRGNLYRIDYDKGETLWSWQLTSGNFHEYNKFGKFQFE